MTHHKSDFITGNVIKSYKELFTLNVIQLRKNINVIYLFDMLWKKVLNTIIDKTITFISFLIDVQGNIHKMLKCYQHYDTMLVCYKISKVDIR